MKYQISNFKIPVTKKDDLRRLFLKKYHLTEKDIITFDIQKESIDARKKDNISLNYNLIVETKKVIKGSNVAIFNLEIPKFEYPKWNDLSPIIVGFGPAGIFSALYLSRIGANPIIIERGGDMDKRIKDVELFLTEKIINPNSNIQFGEGGAGTFSDGKLTTNAKDPLINFILDEFVKYGAKEELKYASMPHIGTDYLRKVIKAMRQDMMKLGAKFYFDTTFTDFKETSDGLIVTAGMHQFKTNHLILALGHSAHDTFKLLRDKKVKLEAKAFSIGVRIEHKRDKINEMQYGSYAKFLPAASYKLAVHLKDRSVYTFCMCPGGEVMASASSDKTIVTNGMSYYDRGLENSNSALLVGINVSDFYNGDILDGIKFQQKWEEKAFLVGNDYQAPANLVGEFLKDEIASSSRSVKPSYPHGVIWCDLKEVLPNYVIDSLKEALPLMDLKMKGFNDPDAVLTGVETRSSSPIRIIRDETRMSSVKGLYPVGEGAGYAGGITTAALDGLKTALKIAKEPAYVEKNSLK